MNKKKKISAKPRGASNAPLSPRGEAFLKRELEEPATPFEPFEENSFGGLSEAARVLDMVDKGSRALREMSNTVEAGKAEDVRQILDAKSLDPVLCVLQSPYFYERGWYGGEKMPTFASAWDRFDASLDNLLSCMQGRFPDSAGEVEDLRISLERFTTECDLTNLHQAIPEARCVFMSDRDGTFLQIERFMRSLFVGLAFRVRELTEIAHEDTPKAKLKAYIAETQQAERARGIVEPTGAEDIIKALLKANSPLVAHWKKRKTKPASIRRALFR